MTWQKKAWDSVGKKVEILVCNSRNNPGLLSIRDLDGHVSTMKRGLVDAGFQDGERAVIVSKADLEKILEEREKFRPFFDAYYK